MRHIDKEAAESLARSCLRRPTAKCLFDVALARAGHMATTRATLQALSEEDSSLTRLVPEFYAGIAMAFARHEAGEKT